MSVPKPPAGHFTVLYFAAVADFTKKPHEILPAPLKAAELVSALEDRYPGIANKLLESCAFTVNLDYVDLEESGDTVIQEGDEVAVIPPVSSG
jgi:molybdopterin converting factor small subunit